MRLPLRRLFAAIPVAALLVAMLAAPAFADPRDFSLTNNSSIVLTNVFVGPSASDDWGDDIMGNDVVQSGGVVNITFKKFDGETCLYYIKVLGQQGQEGYLYKVDLCQTSYVTFSDK